MACQIYPITLCLPVSGTSLDIHTRNGINAVDEWNKTAEVCVDVIGIEMEIVPHFILVSTSDNTAEGSTLNACQ